MTQVDRTALPVEESPVTDVRRVRERLSAEFGNDVARLAEHARCVARRYREQLGLKPVCAPDDHARGDVNH